MQIFIKKIGASNEAITTRLRGRFYFVYLKIVYKLDIYIGYYKEVGT
jgi:hypothetical protein